MTRPDYFIKQMPKWSLFKFIFIREHRELNDMHVSKLSDIVLFLYVLSWVTIAYFGFHNAVGMNY